MGNKGKVFVISGPSGAGKSTVVFKAMAKRNDMCFSTSVTTRGPRPGETDGKEYFFISRERFNEMVADGELLEHAEYVGNGYGTPRAYVEQKLEEGMNVVLDIEVQGAGQVHEKMPDSVMIFIVPPSLDALRLRLEGRKTESAEKIEARLRRARQEYREAVFYQYVIVNDDADTAAAELSAIITAEHCRFEERTHFLEIN